MKMRRGEQSQWERIAPATAMVLVDAGGRPLYYNREAIAVLTYPRQAQDFKNLSTLLPHDVLSVLSRSQHYENSHRTEEFRSGRRRYMCRSFTLDSCSAKRWEPITVLLLERESGKAANFSEVAERFKLTMREQELVGLLTLGLTSKEIAGRMNISPNTVKTFFHLVMTKMGVCTRAGIVGKIART